jgi:hypothetical protein
MAITRTDIEGNKIICEITSSNLKRSEYDIENKTLKITFNNEMLYEYEEVPHSIYSQFRLSDSQGKYFNQNIAKKFKYKKL